MQRFFSVFYVLQILPYFKVFHIGPLKVA